MDALFSRRFVELLEFNRIYSYGAIAKHWDSSIRFAFCDCFSVTILSVTNVIAAGCWRRAAHCSNQHLSDFL